MGPCRIQLSDTKPATLPAQILVQFLLVQLLQEFVHFLWYSCSRTHRLLLPPSTTNTTRCEINEQQTAAAEFFWIFPGSASKINMKTVRFSF